MEAGLIGRDDELDAIRSVLASPPGVGVIEGEAGIGKTTLLRAGIAEARARGYTVLESSGTGAEARLSFSTLRDLLDDVFDAIADQLPPPRRRALAVTLLREEPGEHPPDPGTIGVSLLTALRLLAARRPVLVAIDDVQWLDAGSAAPLAYVMRRLRDEPIVALVTRRPGARLPDRVPYTTVRLGPVSLGSLGRMLRERLDVTYPRPTLQRLHAATAGNPLFALEAAQALEPPLAPGASLPVPATLRALVSERLTALGDAPEQALLVAAALPRPTLDLVNAALGRDARSALEAANVVTLDGGIVRFVHPLFSAAVYERAPADARRDVHRRLAQVVRGLEERARHLALATETPDTRVATVVEAAATTASSRGSPAAAAELIAHARRLTPPAEHEGARRRALAAVDYEFAAGDTARAWALLDEALADAPPGRHRALLRSRRARLRHFADDIGASVDELYAALADAGDDAPLRTEIEESLAWRLLLVRRDVAAAAEHASAAGRWAERAGDRAALAQALAAEALTCFVLGREWEDTMRRALALEEATAHLGVLRQPSFAYGYCLSCTDELDRARDVFEDLRRRAIEQGDESAMPSILNHLALIECLAGEWDGAARLAEEAHALALEGGHRPTQASTLAKRAMVAARRGDVEAARDAAEHALTLAGGPEQALARGGETAIWTLGFLELSVGDPAAADRHLLPLAEALVSAGIRAPGEMRCLPDAIESLAALGRPDEAEPLLDALGAAGRCRGLVLAARGEHEAALGALEHAAALPELPFEHARTLLALGTEQRRARQRRAARATLEQAQADFEALGASLWAAKAQAELGRIGGRAPSSGELTPAERRVAELVAAGRTNREVAETLVLSVHTVEAALTQAYRKLGVRSRTELARLYR